MNSRKKESCIRAYAKICKSLGLSLSGDASETPRRVVEMLCELTSSVKKVWTNDPADLPFKFTTFLYTGDSVVTSVGMEFSVLCEHHHLPFIGEAAVGYLPNRKIAGLSKIPRVIDWISKAPTTQEVFTDRIADFILHHLNPTGLVVQTKAKHTCVCARGPRSCSHKTVVTVIRGQDGFGVKDEILATIKGA